MYKIHKLAFQEEFSLVQALTQTMQLNTGCLSTLYINLCAEDPYLLC